MAMDKLRTGTPDATKQNIERVADLFPECLTEGPFGTASDRGAPVIDFDLLRQALSDHVVEGPQERYRLDWPGKRQALLAANRPIDKTLRPIRDDSVDFDTTRNLFIEGNNLEALKLLQETYLGKVKIIYIDPPYNTGGDFIYKDDFSQSRSDYEEGSGQRDATRGRLVANPESNGRFHSDWLSMMYSRIRLAKDLLADDGVIFASIADDESANLKRIFDEIFGERNFIDTIVVEMSTTSGPKTVNAQQGQIVKNVEFVHVYRKSAEFDRLRHVALFDGITSFDTHYSYFMNDDGSLSSLSEKLVSDEVIGEEIERYGLNGRGGFSIKRLDKLLVVSDAASQFIENNLERIARVDRPPVSAAGRATVVQQWERFEVDHRPYFLTTIENGTLQALIPLSLNFRTSDDYKPRFGRSVIRGDLWKGFHQDMGNVAKEGGIAFANGKKPVRLIQQLMKWANNGSDGIVLDFFAGSGTTAQAVFQQNSADGGNRRFILVQLDEKPEPNSDAARAGYSTIAALARDRIRNAAATLAKTDGSDWKGDTGFRAFRIDSANLLETRMSPKTATQESLAGMIRHIKDDRSEEDLLFGALLAWGIDLALPVAKRDVAGRNIWVVGGPAEVDEGPVLIACFARPSKGNDGIDTTLGDALARMRPQRVLFRDDGFASDAAMENVRSRFTQLAPDTDVKVL